MKYTEHVVNNELVFLSKRMTGYKQVYPIIVDGEFNWKNFLTGGTYAHLLKVAIIVLLILGVAYSYNHDQQEFRQLHENPCEYAPIAAMRCMELNQFEISLEELNLDGNR